MGKKQEVAPPVERTSLGLRNAIFDEIDALRQGKSSASRANAVARLAQSIVNTVHLEVEVRRSLTPVPGEVCIPDFNPLEGRSIVLGGVVE